PALPSSPAADKPVYSPETDTYVPAKTARKRRAARGKVRRKTAANAYSRRTAARRAKPVPPTAKPERILGRKTAGTPTVEELAKAATQGTLKVNRAGAVTTPKVRKASRQLTQAKRIVKRSSAAAMRGLSPEERDAAKYAKRAHREYPDVPTSVLMAQQRQESGFDPTAVSSADAFGRSQFIPSTAAAYGVQPGSSKRAKQSQATGQAHYLHDLGFASDPQGALSSYSGGYAASDYNNPVLEGARDYKGLDRPVLTKGQRAKVKRAQVAAKEAGLKSRGGAGLQQPVGRPSKKVVTRFRAAKAAMKEVEGLPYVWGGGHGSPSSSPTGGGLDCSGAVGYVLNKIGAMKGSLTSGAMGSVLKPGPGALTVFYNDEHTFLRLGNEYWGTSVGDSGAGGLGPHPTPSKEYLASYNVGHVSGLGQKVAMQLGVAHFDQSGAPTLPGMSLSEGGTVATIEEGTTKAGKPGFSKMPIKLTPGQVARRKFAKLRKLGVAVGGKGLGEAPKGKELSRLEETYGVAAV
ncbi:MAG TPA: transglycosylase SLT domain-containing protein, partial [Blastocatellia bacterium]|nr:transglycosylase SLT domain-containing protein [Blastocatellia bacterium]